jgi:hypothetical protein
VNDLIFVHLTRHTCQVANTLYLAFWEQILHALRSVPWWTHLSMPISCVLWLVLGRSSDFWLQDWTHTGAWPETCFLSPWFVSMAFGLETHTKDCRPGLCKFFMPLQVCCIRCHAHSGIKLHDFTRA